MRIVISDPRHTESSNLTEARCIHHWRILWSSYRKLAWGIWTLDHWILFRRSNQLSYQVMSSTRTLRQICTANPISSFVQCYISFWLLPSSVATFNRNFLEVITWVYRHSNRLSYQAVRFTSWFVVIYFWKYVNCRDGKESYNIKSTSAA